MAPDNETVPLKRVLQLCDVSRATLWRVSRARVEGFPEPAKRAGRLYWRADDIEALRRAIENFEGRTVFDQRRRTERLRAALKRNEGRARRPRAPKEPEQDDLFA